MGALDFRLNADRVTLVDANGNALGSGIDSAQVIQIADTTGITATAAAGAGVTITIPAVAAKFNYLAYLSIVMYAAAALTGGATPVVVTSTGLSGTPAWTFPTAAAIGTLTEEKVETSHPIKGTAINTAMTIVAPATPNVIWRVTAAYFVR